MEALGKYETRAIELLKKREDFLKLGRFKQEEKIELLVESSFYAFQEDMTPSKLASRVMEFNDPVRIITGAQ